jgi:RND family efflux transporter MFP subunit
LFLVCLLCLGSFAGCGGAAPSAEKREEAAAAAPEVTVVAAERVVWPQTVRVQGVLLEDEQSVVGSKIAGRVEVIHVDLGSQVRRGEPLVTFDTRELEILVRQAQAHLRQARAAVGLEPDQPEDQLDPLKSPPVLLEKSLLDEARANAERGRQFASRGAATAAEMDNLVAMQKAAEARYESALNQVGEKIALIGVRRVELELAEQRLADAQVVAPFDGVVVHRHVAPGEYLPAGASVVTLIRSNVLRFTAGVPENKAVRVRPGQGVRIHPADGAPPVEATVSRVSPSLDQSSRALRIEADVPNADRLWRAGLFAEADIVIDPDAECLAVPLAAVTEFAGVEKVWVVRDGKAAEQPVRTGRRDEHRVEILDGLSGGDLIVKRGEGGQPGPVVAVLEPSSSKQATADDGADQSAGGPGIGLSE